MTRSWLLPALFAMSACGPHVPQTGAMAAQAPQEMPAWQTETGRREVWRNMATWYIENKQADLAMEMVQRLHEAGEYTPELDVIQARAQIAQGIPQEAIRLLQSVLKKRGNMVSALQTIAVAYADLEDYPNAIDALQKAVKLAPHDAATHNNLGFLLFSSGRCQEAVPEFEAALSEDGSVPRYRNNLAFAAVCLGDHARALSLFRTTMGEADARYNMGIAYERQQAIPSAVLQYEAALQANPDHALAKEALERLDAHNVSSHPPPPLTP